MSCCLNHKTLLTLLVPLLKRIPNFLPVNPLLQQVEKWTADSALACWDFWLLYLWYFGSNTLTQGRRTGQNLHRYAHRSGLHLWSSQALTFWNPSAEEKGQHGFYILQYLIHKIRPGIKPTSNRDCTIYMIFIMYSVYFRTRIFPDSVTDKASR